MGYMMSIATCVSRPALRKFAGATVSIILGTASVESSLAGPGETILVAKSRSSSTAIKGSVAFSEPSVKPAMSLSGRYVAFRSTAPNLVADDDNLHEDVFLFDRSTATNIRIENPQACSNPLYDYFNITDTAISNNGRYVLWSVTDYCHYDDSTTGHIIILDRQLNTRQVLGPGIDVFFTSAQFSADSRYLVFEENDWSRSNIWLYDLATSQSSLVSPITEDDYSTNTSPSISADGSLIVFVSDSPNLVANDTNNGNDVFLYKRLTGQIELISKSSAGAQGNAASSEPHINSSGTHVVYSSEASNLIAGDTNSVSDVFVFTITSGTTSRISKRGTTQLNGPSFHPSISSDARYVTFSSLATNATIDDTNASEDVFLRDRQEATTTRLSVSTTGGQGNGSSRQPTISGNGRYVMFASKATNFAANDLNRAEDLFLLDRSTLNSVVVTKSVEPIAGLRATAPSVTANGSQVAFATSASLVAGDTNETSDVYVRDFKTNRFVRISVTTDGGQPTGFADSFNPCISRNGRFVGFASNAADLVPGDTNEHADIFLRDRTNLTTVRVSVSTDGTQSDQHSLSDCQVSTNGRFVLFSSYASTLVPGDESHSYDLFLRDLVAGTTEFAAVTPTGERVSDSGVMSPNGLYIAFATRENIAPGDTEFDEDVYLRVKESGALERISVPKFTLPEPFNSRADVWAISPDGRFVVFSSNAPNLVAGDVADQSDTDVFIRDRLQQTTRRVSNLPIDVASLRRWISSASLSDDGRFVSFTAEMWSTGPFRIPRFRQVFWRDMQKKRAVRVSRSTDGELANDDAYDSSMNSDGRVIAFTSVATNLVSEPIEGETIFLHERPATSVTP
jgi:Tol biopolymer transport system component